MVYGFYINLDSRTDRRAEFESECQKMGISVERFPAIRMPNAPAIGCSKSHLECLKLARTRKYPYVYIFEDDFECLVTSDELQSILSVIPIEFDVVMLSYNLRQSAPYNATFGKVIESQTASGYIVHSKFYDALIARLEEGVTRMERDPSPGNICTCINDQYWKTLQPTSNWLYSLRRIGRQRPSYSDLERRNVDYGV